MRTWHFSDKKFVNQKEGFEKFFEIFQELLYHTSNDVEEALAWLTELDKQYDLSTPEYGISDFIDDLLEKGFLKKDKQSGSFNPTSKIDIQLRKKALDDIFSDLNKSKPGGHLTNFVGRGDEFTSDLKPYQYGDSLEHIAISESIKNAHINHGINDFVLTQDDLSVHETYYKSQTSTVLMIDISHSMILYGEDRITPAKKVAMALAELIKTRYPKDSLDVIVFGNDAWRIKISDLPYLKVGPFHTNTVAGLELAMEILKKKKNSNKQIMMITDGKPTCIKKGKKYYKNPFGLDKTIVNRTLALAKKCRKSNISITTFMIAKDYYLRHFVEQFTHVNQGKAYYSSLDGLGSFIFKDYKSGKKRR